MAQQTQQEHDYDYETLCEAMQLVEAVWDRARQELGYAGSYLMYRICRRLWPRIEAYERTQR